MTRKSSNAIAISAIEEEYLAFDPGQGFATRGDGVVERGLGPRAGLAQVRLELSEELLDRVEVGRVGRSRIASPWAIARSASLGKRVSRTDMFSRQALCPSAQANQLLPRPLAPMMSRLRRLAIQPQRRVCSGRQGAARLWRRLLRRPDRGVAAQGPCRLASGLVGYSELRRRRRRACCQIPIDAISAAISLSKPGIWRVA